MSVVKSFPVPIDILYIYKNQLTFILLIHKHTYTAIILDKFRLNGSISDESEVYMLTTRVMKDEHRKRFYSAK